MYAEWAMELSPYVIPAFAFALLACPIGLAGIIWTSRRSFERRNFAGVEQFPSYWNAVGVGAAESLVRFVGMALLYFGMLSGFFATWVLWLK